MVSIVINLSELVAGEVSLSGVCLHYLLLHNDVLGELGHDVVIVVLVVEGDLHEVVVILIHGAVHLRQIYRSVGVVDLAVVLRNYYSLWHLGRGHTLGKNPLSLLLPLGLQLIVLLNLALNGLFVGGNSVVEILSAVLILRLQVNVFIELAVVNGFEGRFVLLLFLFLLNLLHLLLKFLRRLVHLVQPHLVMLLVRAPSSSSELQVIVLFELV